MKALKYTLLTVIVIVCFGFIFLGTSPVNYHKKAGPIEPQATVATVNPVQPAVSIPGVVGKSENGTTGGRSYTEYLSQNMITGVVGTVNGSDSPSDNIFVVDLDKQLNTNKRVWLEYDLYGVEDFNSITRSINDNLATGGCVVKKSEKWTKQREAIKPEFLKTGKNIIRFTAPVDKNYLYMVKNVSLRVEDNPAAGERRLVVNQPTTAYYYKTFGYLQGFVEGSGSDDAVVTINSKRSRVINGVFEDVVQKPLTSDESWTAIVEAKFADGQLLQTTVHFDKPIEWDIYNGFDKTLYQAESFVQAYTPFEVKLQGASIQSDSCTLASDANISITALRDIDFPPLEAGMINVTGGHSGYRFLPHGTHFDGDINVTLSYDSCLIPTGYTPRDIVTYYFDETSRRWVALPRESINLANNSITSATSHFTDMINGIIKLPESPQANAFTPTSIKDIKAANPLEGMEVIEPPTANNKGTANLSYPIDIPAGRKGMQPSLVLQYNSEGGNGWMGLGWNISVPSMSVETRWGVPHYDPNFETETYLLNGEQLVTADELNPPEYITRNKPIFRDDSLRQREPLDRRFYPRVEGAFDKIIRHGDAPSHYWWEVIDRNGVTNYYGKRLDGDDLDPFSVLRDTSGNIAYWALTQTKDLHGNAVAYYYDIVYDAGIPNGTVKGKQIYLKSINYTGFQEGNNYHPGFYDIEFSRYDNSQGQRKDVIINARSGFKEVTGCLLKAIKINGYSPYSNLIRSYYFSYTTGEFSKTLLCAFCEVDKQDGESIIQSLEQMTLNDRCGAKDLPILKKHVFTYHNDIKIGEGTFQLFNTTPVNLNTHDDHVAALLRNGKYTTAISGTKSKDKGVGGSFQVGLGRKTWSKAKSLGVSYDYSKSESNGHNTLIDLNGDGLPDKVFYQRDYGLKYRKQYQGADGLYYFDNPVQISGHDKFLYEESVTNTWGGEINFFLQGGICNPVSNSYTKIYFSDANGDGLPDIVDNGTIYYNTLNSSGDPSFEPNVTDTISVGGIPCQYTVFSGEVNDSVDISKERDVPQPDVDETPLVLDNVRYWVAPYSGTITIKSKIQLLQDTSFARKNSRKANGVRYKIQHNSYQLCGDTLGSMSYAPKYNNYTFSVSKGERIYFRLQSEDDRTYDKVIWNPVIFYEDTSVVDPDQKRIKVFNAASDFLLNSVNKFYAPVSGSITIDGTIDIPALSDDVSFTIVKNGNITVFDTTISSGTSIVKYISRSINISEDDSLEFLITSSTNVKWSSVKFKPHIVYNQVGQDPPMYVICENGIDSINPFQYFPTVNYSIFQEPLYPTTVNTVVGSGTQYISPRIHFNSSHSGGQIVMAIKKSNQLLAKQTLTIASNTVLVTTPQLGFPATNGTSFYIEYFTSNRALAMAIDSCRSLYNGVYYNSGLHTVAEDSMISKFGCLYRGWGQFAYNNVAYNDYNNPIYESKLFLSKTTISDTNFTINDTVYNDLHTTISENTASPRKSYLMPMSVDIENNLYTGLGNLAWILADTMGNIPVFKNDTTYEEAIPLITVNGGKVRTINKKTKSKSWCYSLSYSQQGFGASVNGSHGHTQTLMDYVDINGDKYPDIVGDSYVQFSTQQGGLLSNVTDFTQINEPTLSRSDNWAISANASTSFPLMNKKPSSSVGKILYSLRPTGSLSISRGIGTSNATYSWIDVNGDGLPDKVSNSGEVFMNLGYELAAGEAWDINAISTSRSFNKGSSFGGLIGQDFQKNNYSFSGGLGLGTAVNKGFEMLSDINGDGLIDRVYLDGTLLDSTMHVKFNTGNGNWTTEYEVEDQPLIENGLSRSETVNLAGTGGIFFPIPPTTIVLKFELSLHGALTWGFNTGNIQLMDINNDGYPDLLMSDQENTLTVFYSNIRNTNLLKSVDNYIGGSFEINYGLTKSTFDCPSRMRTMNSVKVFDGFPDDGPAYKLTNFEYDSAYYSRFERESFGFRIVKTHQINTDTTAQYCYRTKTEKFHNTNYLFKGLKYYELTQDRNDNKYIESKYTYILKTIAEGDSIDIMHPYCYGEGYPAISQEDHFYYEGQVNPTIHTAKRYRHGRFGNVTDYHDYGQVNLAWDDMFSHVEYHEIPNSKKNIVSSPKSIDVSGVNNPLRYRDAVIDTSNGNVLQLNMETGFGTATYNMRYDYMGNLVKIMYPPNVNGQFMVINYSYDPYVQTYIQDVIDTLGYHAKFYYDPEYGNLLSSWDITGNHIDYAYDQRGRLVSVTAPYEQINAVPYTIKFEYWDRSGGIDGSQRPDKIPWARTLHYDPEYPNNPIKTLLFSDAQGKALQVKKDISLWNSSNNTDEERMSVSGRVRFDAFDRTIMSYYPRDISLSNDSVIDTVHDAVTPSIVKYDVLDRQIQTTTPDNKVTRYNYGFGADFYSDMTFKTSITDANNHVTMSFADAGGRKTSVKAPYTTWTGLKYNALGELIESRDPDSYLTQYQYDWLGRKILRQHPDAGKTFYTYDLAGNLIHQQTAYLSSTSEDIDYTYEFNRLTEINYPHNPENNVKYEYGAYNSSGSNEAGRITKQLDASGLQQFWYGRLGEIIKNTHSFVLPHDRTITFTTLFKYDSWNRMKKVTYPDGEVVSYKYNNGGLLKNMRSVKSTQSFKYVNDVHYDKFEKRTYIWDGNGTKTEYYYDNTSQKLHRLISVDSSGTKMLDKSYDYDNTDNITQISDAAPKHYIGSDTIGGNSIYNYDYDSLYRLVTADGTCQNKNKTDHYELGMAYSPSGLITVKGQIHTRNGVIQTGTSYNHDYVYSTTQPHTPILIGYTQYDYNANGDMIRSNDMNTGTVQKLRWDEENRLKLFCKVGPQDQLVGSYLYDAGGERYLKILGTHISQTISGHTTINGYAENGQTLYVNPFMVVNDRGYSKHFYIEGERIATKIGEGMNISGTTVNEAGTPSNLKWYRPYVGFYQDSTLQGFNLQTSADYDDKTTAVNGMLDRDLDSINEGPYLSFTVLLSPVVTAALTQNNNENQRYYFHPDHLGSSNYVSDVNGLPTERLEYFPYGEILVNENRTTYSTPYKFSAKELDGESGLSYFGARYLDTRNSIWLGVDPLADKYPGWSPFVYCMDNPIILIDPDGRSVGWVEDQGQPTKGVYWDPKINSASEAADAGKTYHGQTANLVDSKGNFSYGDQNGDLQPTAPLNGVETCAEYPYKATAQFWRDDKGYGPSTNLPMPDYLGLSLSGNAFLGGGFGVDLTFGYVKDEGSFANLSLREGVGVDISAGIGINVGYYSGVGMPSSSGLSQLGSYQNFGSSINITSWQDISSMNGQPRVGDYWKGFSLDFSAGSKTVWGGSVGTSITTNPLR